MLMAVLAKANASVTSVGHTASLFALMRVVHSAKICEGGGGERRRSKGRDARGRTLAFFPKIHGQSATSSRTYSSTPERDDP